MAQICPLWPCCSPASLSHSLCSRWNTTDAPGWPPAFPVFPLTAEHLDSAGSLRQSCTPFSVPAEDVSYSWGWIDVWLKAVGCSPASVHGCHFDSTKQTAKFLNGSVPEKLFWVLFCFFCSGTVPIIASLKLLHMGADCSWVRQGRDWHWIAGIKSQLPFWTLSCTSVVCSFILPVLFCSKMKHCGKLMLLVQWSLLGVAVLCNHPTQPLAAPTEMPEVQISSFLMGDTASIPAVILGCFAGCISNLHPESIPQQLLIPASLNICSTSRKSRNFSTVLIWCFQFAYILRKLSTRKFQTPNQPVSYLSKLNYREKYHLLGKYNTC